ncbi:hypothetical protein ELG71_08250 [Rhizobium leguminosarum]|uniref:hypothetical protein n=1 Tax=Rhizobium leguminosarum TaxID=384 RepID=UPI00102FE8AD|nr:hypothetical protein [Rhizobium leguminosarum]TBG58344.1 hypothetical protein ELG71_08250 [Rhizobium leguminosarum]
MQNRRGGPKNVNRHQPKIIYVSVAPADFNADEKIKWALREIQSDLNKNNGVYPYSSRKPGIQEVLRRADLGKSYLEKKGEDSVRDKIQSKRKEAIKAGISSIRGTVFPPVVAWAAVADESDQIAALKQKWHVTILELEEAQHRIEVLERELARALSQS